MTKKNTILIVEDDPDMREMLEEVLADAGYDTLAANNGAAGLQIFTDRFQDIGLVITDMWMPQMNGAGLLKAIRDIDSDLPVIVMTGFDWVDYAAAINDKESCTFLAKPFQTQQLLKACRAFLNAMVPCFV